MQEDFYIFFIFSSGLFINNLLKVFIKKLGDY